LRISTHLFNLGELLGAFWAWQRFTGATDLPVADIVQFLLVAGALVWLAQTVERVLLRTLRWVGDGYDKANQQAKALSERSAELQIALKSLQQSSFAVARANEQLQVMVKIAEDARRSKQEFAATISHELRTPLNLIIGFSEVMLNPANTYKVRGLPQGLLADIRVVHRNAQHLLKLVNDILDLSQMDANHMTIVREPVQVADFVRASLDDFADLMRARHLSLTLDIAPDLPDVYADRTRIRQVLLNLVANALRFTDHGGLTIRAQLTSGGESDGEGNAFVSANAAAAPSHVVIAVRDTGIGIALDDLKRIFEPFTQVDGSLQRKHGGTGLGLSISKQFVELHGGQMSVTSEPGMGSTFSFSLPLHVPAPERYLDRAWGPMRQREVGVIAVIEEGMMLTRVLQRSFEGIEFFRTSSLGGLFADGANPCPEAIIVNSGDPSESRATLPAEWPPEWQRVPVLHCHVPGPELYLKHERVKRFLTKPITQDQFNTAIAELLTARRDKLDASGQPEAKQVARILLVEDDEDALHLLSRLLRAVPPEFRADFAMLSAVEVRSGAQALEVLRSAEADMLDGVLLDLGLGVVSGQDVLTMMSSDPTFSALPVCIVSGQLLGAETLVATHLTVTKRPGLNSRELIQAIRALLPIVLPGFKPLLQEGPAA
jgi:signal transduction histidine kinase/CheY-like chemotaxis protein